MTDTQDQPVIESRRKGALTVDGLTFKDLDGDGQLAPYEDWRLSPRERAADPLTRMSSDEKTGLMIIGSHFMGDSPMAPNPTEGKLLNEDDNWADKHPISGVPFERPVLASSGARQGIPSSGISASTSSATTRTPIASRSGPTRCRRSRSPRASASPSC